MEQLNLRDRLIVALDYPDLPSAEHLVNSVSSQVGYFKVGFELYLAAGPKAIALAKQNDAKVFLDLKLHDIPNTVGKAVEQLINYGVNMMTVHISGGAAMIHAAREAAERRSAALGITRPLILGVTVLTSLNEEDLLQDGNSLGLDELVVRRALLAQANGADGVICSPREAALVKRFFGGTLYTVTPGIRMITVQDDQKRVTTPAAAMAGGSDYIVVGRAITAAEDPAAAVQAILQNMKEGL